MHINQYAGTVPCTLQLFFSTFFFGAQNSIENTYDINWWALLGQQQNLENMGPFADVILLITRFEAGAMKGGDWVLEEYWHWDMNSYDILKSCLHLRCSVGMKTLCVSCNPHWFCWNISELSGGLRRHGRKPHQTSTRLREGLGDTG